MQYIQVRSGTVYRIPTSTRYCDSQDGTDYFEPLFRSLSTQVASYQTAYRDVIIGGYVNDVLNSSPASFQLDRAGGVEEHRHPQTPSSRRAESTDGTMQKSTRIKILLVIDTLFFLLEIIVGYAVHSLALVADSFHMVCPLTLDRPPK